VFELMAAFLTGSEPGADLVMALNRRLSRSDSGLGLRLGVRARFAMRLCNLPRAGDDSTQPVPLAQPPETRVHEAAGFFCRSSFALRSASFASISAVCFCGARRVVPYGLASWPRAAPPRPLPDAKRQVIADEQWRTVQEEDQQNNELLDLSRQILQLTKEVRALTAQHQPQSGSALDSGERR
jgi:hypothetical protein